MYMYTSLISYFPFLHLLHVHVAGVVRFAILCIVCVCVCVCVCVRKLYKYLILYFEMLWYQFQW